MQLSAHAQNHASPERCCKSFTVIFLRDHPREPVPEENFCTLWCKINRGRDTDQPAGRHFIRTNQCPPPPSPHIIFTGWMPFLPPNQQASKHWRQLAHSDKGEDARVLLNGVTCTVSKGIYTPTKMSKLDLILLLLMPLVLLLLLLHPLTAFFQENLGKPAPER